MDTSLDLIMVSTTQPEKQLCLGNTIPTIIDKFKFNNLFIGIDVIDKNKLDDKVNNILYNLNFKVDTHRANGMVNNLASVIHSSESEWILYCEDDIILDDFPNFQNLLKFIYSNFDDSVGIIDLMPASGVRWNSISETNFKNNFINLSYHKEFDNFHLFERDIESFDMYFINFPIILIKREIFQSCFDYAYQNCKGLQIERGFSFAYYAMGYHKMYKKIHIWNNFDFNIDECNLLTGLQIADSFLIDKILLKNRITHPELHYLHKSVLHVNIPDRVESIYSF